MVEKTLDEALREAGLGDPSIRLVIENKLIAQALATSAKKLCERFVAEVVRATPTAPPVLQYRGKYDFSRIPEAVAAIRARREKITQKAVAKELRCGDSFMCQLMKRHPEIKVAYLAALNGSARP